MEAVLEDMQHIDILHIARRIWRWRLPTCDLKTLGQWVLGLERQDDIPGELIPHIYFDFLTRRKAWLLLDVFEHNFWDIVHMALLTLRVTRIGQEPVRHLQHPDERLSLAHFFYQQRYYNEAQQLLESILSQKDRWGPQRELNAFFQLAMILKKKGEGDRAKEYLWELVKRNHRHPRVIEELAKFYEHHDRDYKTALKVVELGLQYLEMQKQLDRNTPVLRFLPALRHRRNRLLKRLRKHPN